MSTVNRAARDPRFPDLDDADIAALRALMTYTASAEQQRIAVNVICQKICEVNGLGWHSDNERLTSFAQGKRLVGLTLMGSLAVKPQPQETK